MVDFLAPRHTPVFRAFGDQHRHRSAGRSLAAGHGEGQRGEKVGSLCAEEGGIGGLSINNESAVFFGLDRRERRDSNDGNNSEADKAALVTPALRSKSKLYPF